MARVMTFSGMVKTLKMIDYDHHEMGNPQPSPKFIFIVLLNK
jgi:hypothetical protein